LQRRMDDLTIRGAERVNGYGFALAFGLFA
jgi:hypothetical protein